MGVKSREGAHAFVFIFVAVFGHKYKSGLSVAAGFRVCFGLIFGLRLESTLGFVEPNLSQIIKKYTPFKPVIFGVKLIKDVLKKLLRAPEIRL